MDTKFAKISCGMSFKAALSNTGELYAWGNNDYGQCACDPEKD